MEEAQEPPRPVIVLRKNGEYGALTDWRIPADHAFHFPINEKRIDLP
jgi:hypothetical protein